MNAVYLISFFTSQNLNFICSLSYQTTLCKIFIINRKYKTINYSDVWFLKETLTFLRNQLAKKNILQRITEYYAGSSVQNQESLFITEIIRSIVLNNIWYCKVTALIRGLIWICYGSTVCLLGAIFIHAVNHVKPIRSIFFLSMLLFSVANMFCKKTCF